MNNIRIRQKMIDIIQSNAGDWIEKIPVITGNQAGVVDAGNGLIWVRFNNGQEKTVLNTLMPLKFDVHIKIGRLKSQPGIWRVAEIRESYLESSSQTLNFHHAQHEESGADRINISRKQVIIQTVRVSDADGFIVAVFGGQPRTTAGMALIANQFVNLSGYVPASGAVYVNIESNAAGVLTVNKGVKYTSKESLELAAPASIPLPAAGYYRVATILLYELMGTLLDEQILVPFPLESNPADFSKTVHKHEYNDLALARALKTQAVKIYMNTTML